MMRILVAAAAVAVALALVPLGTSNAYTISVLTSVFMWAYFACCWNILGGMTGQLSFGHSVFFGIAAYASAVLFIKFGWHPLLGGLLGIALATTLGVAIGYVSARYNLVHLHFALVTTAVGQIALFLAMGWQFIGGATGITVPYRATPAQLFFRDPAVYYWIFLAMTAAVLALTLLIRRRRIGLYFLCIRESEPAARGAGIDLLRYKLFAIAISAALTAAGGIIYAHYIRFLDPDSVFGWQVSLQMVIPAMLGGTQAILGPLVGAAIFVVLQETTRTLIDFAGAPLIIVGLVLIPVVLFMPLGVVPSLQRFVRRRATRRSGGAVDAAILGPPVTRAPLADEDVLLRVEGLSRRFGGVQAVSNVSMHCRRGERLAVIGPNGAGKSTLFALLGGFVPPNSGQIWFDGARITGSTPTRSAAAGSPAPSRPRSRCRAFTVRENVLCLRLPARRDTCGRCSRCGCRARDVISLARSAGGRRRPQHRRQKRLEVARACATRPRLILLDEVGAGLTALELEQLVDMVIRAQRRAGHHDPVHRARHVHGRPHGRPGRSCWHISARSRGRPMQEVCANPVVVEAYLGESRPVGGLAWRKICAGGSRQATEVVHGISLAVAAGQMVG